MHSTRQPADLAGCWEGGAQGAVFAPCFCRVLSLRRGAGLVPPAQSCADALKGAGLGSAEGVAPWADSTWKLQWKSLTPFSPAEGA